MYDYDDYEEDVLLVLRVLKYLHGVQTREEFLKQLIISQRQGWMSCMSWQIPSPGSFSPQRYLI